MNFTSLDNLKAKLDSHRPLSADVVKNLHEDLVLRWTYHSNAIEGNGRTSRLLMNLELIEAGYPPVVIHVEDRLEYYKALDTAHTTGDSTLFLELMEKVVEKSFEPYFYVLGIGND